MDYTVPGILRARILERVAFPFSRGPSQPRDRTQVSCMQADSLPAEIPGKPIYVTTHYYVGSKSSVPYDQEPEKINDQLKRTLHYQWLDTQDLKKF